MSKELNPRVWKILLLVMAVVAVIGCGRGQLGQLELGGLVDSALGQAGLRSVADTDRDGIPDGVEDQLGTDPQSRDSDMDGLTDHYELWGFQGIPVNQLGSLTGLPDVNGNGIHAALDQGEMADQVLKCASDVLAQERVLVTMPEDGEFAPNDMDGDGIPNDFELHGYYYTIDPADSLPYFVKWDGDDYSKPYVKTDPAQWSTDGDPFSDWEEVTKINLDQRVKSPGDHPCIPAYPSIHATITSYSVELKEETEVESATGGSSEKAWTNSVETAWSEEDTWEIGGSVMGKFGWGDGTKNQGFYGGTEVTFEASGGKTSVTSSATTNDTSGMTSAEWSNAVTRATDSLEAARLILNLKIVNTGTLPATNAKVLFNLKLGKFIIRNFFLDLTGLGELKAKALNPIDWSVTHDGLPTELSESIIGDPLWLSSYQLRTIQSGAPITLEAVGFTADTLVWDIDPDTGRRTFITFGPWSSYESSIQNVTAKVVLDFSDDPTYAPQLFQGLPAKRIEDLRVFGFSPNSSYVGSPPEIYLVDAMRWAFETAPSNEGPVVTIRDPISNWKYTAPIALWTFGFDRLTIEKIMADPAKFGSVYTIPIEPGNPVDRIYSCSAPPQGVLANPQIYWATCDPKTRKIRAFSRDVRGVKEMRFKPDPDAPYDGEQMTVGFNPEDPHAMFFYTYEIPSQYMWTGLEQVVAINGAGNKTTLNVKIEGDSLGFLTDQGSFGVAWDTSVNPDSYQRGFNFEDRPIVNPPHDVLFEQERQPGGELTITLEPTNGGLVHDAYYVVDPTDEFGNPVLDGEGNPVYLIDYDYLRKAGFTDSALSDGVPAYTGPTPVPSMKTYAVRGKYGALAVFKPLLSARTFTHPSIGLMTEWYVSAIEWRAYEGI